MNAVGKLGSYISRSVYIVSGPFHPFGGAVDIIVVEQPDGSFKSSPWYVRFGKFQGVLQAREKLVTVSVNGVEADFHMYLDHKGEAYFLREIDVEAPDIPLSLPSSVDDTDGGSHSRRPMKPARCNYEAHEGVTPTKTDANVEKTMSRTNSRGSRILGRVFRREDGFSEKINDSGVVRTDSLERAEIAADLLEVKWSTDLVSFRQKKNGISRLTSLDMSEGNDINKLKPDIQNVVESHTHGATTHDTIADNLKDSLVLRKIESADEAKGHSLLSIMTESKGNVEESGTKSLVLGSKHETVTFIVEAERPATMEESSENENLRVDDADTIFLHVANGPEFVRDPSGSAENGISRTFPLMPTFQPLLGSAEDTESESIFTISTFRNSTSPPLVEKNTSNAGKICETQLALDHDSPSLVITGDTVRSNIQKSGDSEEDLLFGDLDDFREIKIRQLKDPISQDHERDTRTETPVSQIKTDANEFSMPNHVYSSSAEMSAHKDLPVCAEIFGIMLKTVSSEINISSTSGLHSEEVRAARSLPNMWVSDSDVCGFDNFIEHTLNSEYFSSKYKFPRQDDLNNVEAKAENDHQPSKSPQLMEDAETNQELKNVPGHLIVEFSSYFYLDNNPVIQDEFNVPAGNSSRPVDASSGNWRIWPFSFRRSRSMEVSESDLGFNRSSGAERENAIEDERDMLKVKKPKKKVRENTPSSDQLASLNLKEGRNTLTFTFSTPMLGKQQVDAQIHLWKWDTRIVISDVDGTITRSDLLGQVMPLVGVDWSQTGVANLFSAIKENGYHMLFLSARAISQSYGTRQLLFNLKQDGKALPEGPVVISPDGLFPSLYREVVRRAPHEFKISCLEAIKALFPSDRNPFYAGFGNRDSDEISYLKVGIPKGKIFIINPKGEIIVNHRVDRKSYTSFHALVNDMFPLMSSSGQEDYNSWNYWKLPLPPIDI